MPPPATRPVRPASPPLAITAADPVASPEVPSAPSPSRVVPGAPDRQVPPDHTAAAHGIQPAQVHRPAAPDIPPPEEAPPAPKAAPPADPWTALREIGVEEAQLDRSLIIAAARRDPAHAAFDVLRTRLLQALRDNGWSRVGITSPTKGCGKSFSALNLAIALSRYDNCRTVLMDMDLRAPAQARQIGAQSPGSIGEVLRGLRRPQDHLVRFAPNRLHIGGNLALGLNDRTESYAAELFNEPQTALVLDGIRDSLRPDVMLFDLPPALAYDDVIAFRAHLDCVLMVVGGGMTTARDVRESVRRIGEDKPLVGIILNKAEGEGLAEYGY